MNLEFLLTSELLLAEIAGFWILTILCTKNVTDRKADRTREGTPACGREY
jgi:hypothetical protein